MDFKNSIRLGIEIDTQSNVEGKLKTLVDSLNNKKIELDLTLKNNDATKSLESLTKLLDNFQSKIGKGISLGDVDKIISNTTNGLTKLNGELLKTTQSSMKNDMVKVVEQTATAIGQVVTQSKTLDKNGSAVGEGFARTTINLKAYKDALDKIALSQKQLNALEVNGFTNKNAIADLKNSLNVNTIGSDNELSKIINKVNELVSTESKIIEYSNKLNTLKSSMANLTDSKFSNVLDNQVFEEIANKIDDTRNKLKEFDGINFNGLKQQYAELSNSVSNLASETINAQKIEQTQADILNKNMEMETKLNNVDFLSNQKNAYIELNKLLEQEYSIKEKLLNADKQTAEALEKSLIVNKLNQTTQKNNIDDNGLINLQKEIELENKLLSLKEKLNVTTAKKNDSNIASLIKEINDAQVKLEKMKQTFGSKLPSGFIESTESELKKLTIQLQQADGVNFVSVKNGLNAIKGSMEQTTTETKQFINSLKEVNNGGFFSNISNFLGKLGVFYGISQVVGEIKNQLKDASEYTITMDKAFTNMQMITGRSKNEISGLVNQYKELGQHLHTTNAEMMSGMEEVTRAGYEGDEGKYLMEASILGSKISGQNTGTTTEQLIAIKNAFDMTGESMNRVVDIISKMDNVSATSFAEIANAIQRTAYSAQEAGTPFDNLVTYITTVSEKTRKSAETIGESFKTIYSRYSNIKLGNIDDDGKTINDTETAMNRIGIAIRTNKGEFKDFDVVLNEFMNKFKSGELSQVDYLAGVQALAGTRQRETLMALMENMDDLKMHQQEVTDATGSAKKMFEEAYSNSLDAKLNDMKRAFEGLYEAILNSDSLKWFIEQLTNIVTTLSKVDGQTIAFIATVGTISLALSKLSKINKELMAMKSIDEVMGLTKLVGLASGMGKLETGATGIASAFGLLTTGIKGAVTASLAFMATPLGMVITAIGVAVAVAGAGFIAYKKHQAELEQQSKNLKSAIDGVNDSLANGDTKGASEKLKEAQAQQKALEDLIETKKKMDAMPESSFYGDMGGATKAQSIQLVQTKIDELTKTITDNGYALDANTGKIQEVVDAESKIANAEIIDSIKEQTKVQLENRENLEGAKTEYDNYIATVKNLYSEYQNLSAQENLSSADKAKLGDVVNQLKGKFGDLNVSIDKNGKAYISNNMLIEDNIAYVESEGFSISTLSAIRISDAKVTSEWQISNSKVTYEEIAKRIGNYKSEILAIRQLAEAKNAYLEQPLTESIRMNGVAETATRGGKSAFESLIDNELGSNTKYKEAQAKLKELENAKNKIDGIYNSIKAPVNVSKDNSSNNYMPFSSGSGSSAKSDAEKAQETAQKLTEEIAKMQSEINPDRYYDLNNAIKDIDNELTTNKTLLDSLNEGTPEYQQAQLKDIELYDKKKQSLANLNAEQKREADEIKSKLSQYSFVFDANGKLINGQQRLLEIQQSVNAMGGSTEADKEKKKEYIDWVKDLQSEIQKFSSLTEDTIPKTANEFNELGNSIKKVREEMKKANEETLGNFRDEIAGYILEDLQKELEKTKEDLKIAEDNDIKNIEEEKQSMIDSYDKKIQSLRDELNALDDDSEDKLKKLEKLKTQLGLWQKDDSSFSAKKQDELNLQISSLEKDIKKDNLNSQISDLEKQKDEESKNYEDRLDEIKSYYEDEEKAQEDSNDSKLLEEKAYQRADKLLKEKNQQEILSLLEGHSTDYKNVGTLLGENFKDGWIEQMEQAKKAYDDLMGDLGSVGSNSNSSGSNTSSSSGSGNVKTGDHAWIADGSTTEFYEDPSHNKSKGTAYSNGVANADELNIEEYNNGFMRVSDSKGKDLGWVERTALNKWNDVKQFADGGRTPSDIDSGALAILHSNENVLNANDTTMLDDIYKYVKDSGLLLSQLSSNYMNLSSYMMTPVLSNSLSDLSNGVVNNNNTSNTDTQSISMPITIINEKGAEQITERTLEKLMTKVQQKQSRRYK